MNKKRTTSAFLILVVLVVCLGSSLYFLLHHEPGFYRRSFVEPGPERVLRSEEFVGQFLTLVNKFKNGGSSGEEPFKENFTQEQFNSFFAEDFVKLGLAQDLEKLGIYEPRVTFDKDHFRLAFRYGEGPLASILSYDFKIWLAPKDINLLAVEVLGRKAGALPIPSQQTLEELRDMARKHSIEVTWYRHQTNPVALVRFIQDSNQRFCAQFQQIELETGKITLAGRSFDPNQDTFNMEEMPK